MVQDEVTWVLETIRENWPELGDSGLYDEDVYGDGVYYDEDGYPADLYRINRDEPKVLESGKRTRSFELSDGNVIGASLASRSPTPLGTEYDHEVETVVSIRMEGLHESEWGHVESNQYFNALVAYAKHALLLERTYPTVAPEDEPGSVDYFELQIENEQPLSNENRDFYRTDFDVRLTGDEKLP